MPDEFVSEPQLATLVLSVDSFDAIAQGRLDVDTVALLTRAERSRRLLLLRHVIVRVRRSPSLFGPLGDPAAALRLLAAAQEKDRDAVEDTLAYPQVGIWVTHAVRLLTGGATSVDPLWVHLGHLSALCAAIAVRAGLDFRLPVPMRHGQVLLPSLGLADLTEPGAEADGCTGQPPYAVAWIEADDRQTVVSAGGTVVRVPRFGGLDSGRWTAMPRLDVAAASGRRLRVTLDHLDPSPGAVGLSPATDLPPARVGTWSHRLAAAWHLLDGEHPDEAGMLAAGLQSIIPLTDNSRGLVAGSSADGFGAVAMVLPRSDVEMACLLVHEFRHSTLNGLLHMVDLCMPDPVEPLFYAPWRDDPRPALGLLHGAYAFTGVTAFWRRRLALDDGPAALIAGVEFALWRLQTARIAAALTRSGKLTALGDRLVASLRRQAVECLRDPVPTDLLRLARCAADTHRAGWRVYHIRPDPAWVAEAADRYWSGVSPPAPPGPGAVVPDAAASCLNWFLVAAKQHLTGDVPLTDNPDVWLVHGDAVAAARGYLHKIAADPTDQSPWSGIGSALASTAHVSDAGTAAAARLLVRRPELVRAVHRQVRDRTPPTAQVVAIARWLAGRPPDAGTPTAGTAPI